MSFEAVAPLVVATVVGIPSAVVRPVTWPLLGNFAFLQSRYYALGLPYEAKTFVVVDALTFSAIVIIVGIGEHIELRDLAILALFLPAAVVYGFVTEPVIGFWILWLVGICQFLLAAPWEYIGRGEPRRRLWRA